MSKAYKVFTFLIFKQKFVSCLELLHSFCWSLCNISLKVIVFRLKTVSWAVFKAFEVKFVVPAITLFHFLIVNLLLLYSLLFVLN